MENIKVIYETKWLLNRVIQVTDNIRHKIVEQTKFEARCFRRLAEYLSKDPNNIKNKLYIERMIMQVASTSITDKFKKECAELIIDGNEETTYEIEDVLANVENIVIGNHAVKEKVALLAQGDYRKGTVLNAWINGNTNDSEISRALACAIGGNESGHRSFVKRFRTHCRQQLNESVS